MDPAPPSLAFAFEARVEIAAPLELGTTAGGGRRVIPIVGGTVAGPRLNGRVVPGGADWQLIRRDGVAEVEARYTLEADDGTLISVVNRGLARRDADGAFAYFRTAPVFETAAGPHDWLTRSLFVGTAQVQPPLVILRFFELE